MLPDIFTQISLQRQFAIRYNKYESFWKWSTISTQYFALIILLNGLSHEINFGFWWLVWLVLCLNRGRGHLKFFRCSNDFVMPKGIFLTINASLPCVNNVSGVYLVQASLLLIWPAGFGAFLHVSALASHWLEDCANFTPMAEVKDQYGANHSRCNTSQIHLVR